jgi:hypothetical protein
VYQPGFAWGEHGYGRADLPASYLKGNPKRREAHCHFAASGNPDVAAAPIASPKCAPQAPALNASAINHCG